METREDGNAGAARRAAGAEQWEARTHDQPHTRPSRIVRLYKSKRLDVVSHQVFGDNGTPGGKSRVGPACDQPSARVETGGWGDSPDVPTLCWGSSAERGQSQTGPTRVTATFGVSS